MMHGIKPLKLVGKILNATLCDKNLNAIHNLEKFLLIALITQKYFKSLIKSVLRHSQCVSALQRSQETHEGKKKENKKKNFFKRHFFVSKSSIKENIFLSTQGKTFMSVIYG